MTETAQQPIELILFTAQLENQKQPSAQIDGLKQMFYYSIQVAGFNSGGLGPLSKPIPIRVGAYDNQNNLSSSICYYLNIHLLLFIILLFILLRN